MLVQRKNKRKKKHINVRLGCYLISRDKLYQFCSFWQVRMAVYELNELGGKWKTSFESILESELGE